MKRPLRSILLVEDDPDIQVVGRLALETVGGFSVRVCGNGREALAALAAELPDLVLMDVMMPELDGPATLAALRADSRTAAIPVVFLTASVDPLSVQTLARQGAMAVLPKPFDPMGLHLTLKEMWETLGPADEAASA